MHFFINLLILPVKLEQKMPAVAVLRTWVTRFEGLKINPLSDQATSDHRGGGGAQEGGGVMVEEDVNVRHDQDREHAEELGVEKTGNGHVYFVQTCCRGLDPLSF